MEWLVSLGLLCAHLGTLYLVYHAGKDAGRRAMAQEAIARLEFLRTKVQEMQAVATAAAPTIPLHIIPKRPVAH